MKVKPEMRAEVKRLEALMGPVKVKQQKVRLAAGFACVGLGIYAVIMGAFFGSGLVMLMGVGIALSVFSVVPWVRKRQERNDPVVPTPVAPADRVIRRNTPVRIDPVTKLPVPPKP